MGATHMYILTNIVAKLDGHGEPYEHVASINTQMTIIRASDSLKCKILSDTFKMQSYDGIWNYPKLLSLSIRSW